MARDNDVFVITNEKEFIAGLRQVDRGLPKAMGKALKKIADHVVGVAQQRMPFGHGTAAKSLKPHGTAAGRSYITFPKGGPESGHDKAGYYPWLDFGGGKTGRRGITASEPITHERSASQKFKREPKKEGRYLYPAVGESKGYISDAVDKELRDLIVDAGWDTRGHA